MKVFEIILCMYLKTISPDGSLKMHRNNCLFCFSSFLCTLCCQFLWLSFLWLPVRYFLMFIFKRSRFFSYEMCWDVSWQKQTCIQTKKNKTKSYFYAFLMNLLIWNSEFYLAWFLFLHNLLNQELIWT
jgi:hypothetical protein